MSIRVMTEVWEHCNLKGTPLLVMLALADYSNDDRYCWPGMETLAQKSRISVRQAQRIVKAMVEQGHLRVEPNEGRHGTNLYHIPPVEKMKVLTDLEIGGSNWGVTSASGVTPMTQSGDAHVTRGVTRMSPEPSLNHHEPSLDVSNETSVEATPQRRRRKIPTGDDSSTAEKSAIEEIMPAGEWKVKRHELQEEFTSQSNIQLPPALSPRDYRQRESQWWGPLKQILYLCEQDMDRSKELIGAAVSHLREKDIPLSDPNSIVKTCRWLASKQETQSTGGWRQG